MTSTVHTHKVKQYNSTSKWVISVDGKPFAIARSDAEAGRIIGAINGAENVILTDGAIKKKIANLLKAKKDEGHLDD